MGYTGSYEFPEIVFLIVQPDDELISSLKPLVYSKHRTAHIEALDKIIK